MTNLRRFIFQAEKPRLEMVIGAHPDGLPFSCIRSPVEIIDSPSTVRGLSRCEGGAPRTDHADPGPAGQHNPGRLRAPPASDRTRPAAAWLAEGRRTARARAHGPDRPGKSSVDSGTGLLCPYLRPIPR